MAESYSVRAVLSAVDKGFSSTLKSCSNTLDKIDSKISGFSFGLLTGAGMAAFNTLKNGASQLVGSINESNVAWKVFASNMGMLGKGQDEIEATKKKLQDFATQTIYSASDMATTYSQLAAVGVKNTDKLVTGFGGLAAAAENPQQAMKTLSQQATQMAAKPKVAWQDFKLMLEQTPAGIAAVAKEMGMTTSQLVSKVQEGEIATDKFFDAIVKVGNNDAFTDLATQYKSAGQGMDGLMETLANKLSPAFEAMSQTAIGGIEGIIGKLEKLDGKALAGKATEYMQKATKYIDAAKEAFSGVGGAIGKAGKAIKKSITGITGAFGSTGSVEGFKGFMETVANLVKKVAGFIEKHADKIGWLIASLPKILIAIKGYKVAKTAAGFVGGFASSLGGIAKKAAGLAGKLKGVPKAQEAVGKSSSISGGQLLTAAKSYALMGVAVLLVAAGFALLAFSAIQLAEAGGGAIAVMAGLVLGVAAMGVGMAFLMKMLAPMSAQLMPVAMAFLAMGAAVLLISVGFALLTQSAIALASAGWPAIGVMIGMVAAIALLAVGAALLGTALTAGAIGFLAFGAALLLVGVAAVLAAAAVVIIASVLPTVAMYGQQGALAIAALGASMIVFAAGAALAGVGCLALGAGLIVMGAGLLVASAGMLVFGASLLVVAAGMAALGLALKAVNSSMKTIAKNAKSAEKSLKSMKSSVKAVESGLDAVGSKAKSAMKSLKSAFDNTAKEANASGKAVADGFVQGMQSGLAAAPARAFSAGAYISIGFAQGMLSQLATIRMAAAQMASAADAAVRAKAKIHSPSRIAENLGAYWGEGYANGLYSMMNRVRDAAQSLVAVPTPELAYGGELSADWDYFRNADYTIEVPLSVDGKEFARATASYTQDELDKRNKRDSRKHGKA